MKIPSWLPYYGDLTFRGACPSESAEQVTFFKKLRTEYPETYGVLAIHPKNEGLRSGWQFQQLKKDKALGFSTGAADIIIPGEVTFVVELKKRDHTQARWEKSQLYYLKAAEEAGCFVGVAFGWEAAWKAFMEWTS